MNGLETLPNELEFDEMELEEVTESESDSDSEDHQHPLLQRQRQMARDLSSSATVSLAQATDNDIVCVFDVGLFSLHAQRRRCSSYCEIRRIRFYEVWTSMFHYQEIY